MFAAWPWTGKISFADVTGSAILLCKLFRERNVEIKITAAEKEILRRGTVDFVSFSYYMSCYTAQKQAMVPMGYFLLPAPNPYLNRNGAGPSIRWV